MSTAIKPQEVTETHRCDGCGQLVTLTIKRDGFGYYTYSGGVVVWDAMVLCAVCEYQLCEDAYERGAVDELEALGYYDGRPDKTPDRWPTQTPQELYYEYGAAWVG